MDESLSALRTEDETVPDPKNAQHTPLDFSLPRLSNGWEETPKFMKRLESHEEFEFTMSHNRPVRADLYEPVIMEVSPADELFFRGQLLPLEHDPRLHLVHTLSCTKGEGTDEVEHCEDVVAMQHASYKACMHRPNEEDFSVHLASTEGFPAKCEDCEGGFLAAGTSMAHPIRINTIRSSRSDQEVLVDSCKNDSRSSSFRSQHSSYWGSGEKDSRDSSGSSRCSNGSSQDASYYGTDHPRTRASHPSMKAMPPKGSVVCIGVNASAKGIHHSCSLSHGKAPLPASAKVRKWSWKTLFNGLRKGASKMWVEDRISTEEEGMDTYIGPKQKRSFLRFHASAGQATAGISGPSSEMDNDADYRFVGGGGKKTLGAMQYLGGSTTNGSRSKELGHADSRSYYTQGCTSGATAPRRAANYYEGSRINGGKAAGKHLERARMGIIAWNARETWQRWVKKPLLRQAKVTTGESSSCTHKVLRRHPATMMMNEEVELEEDTMTACNLYSKSLSSSPYIVKSAVRKGDIDAERGQCSTEYIAASSPLSRMNMYNSGKVGFVASCPASMRSSPHNSGVLNAAVVMMGRSSPSPAAPASSSSSSTLHDLHSAIQGAIAHCKQSHSRT